MDPRIALTWAITALSRPWRRSIAMTANGMPMPQPDPDAGALHWHAPRPLPLNSELHIAVVHRPLTAGQRWRTVLDGHLYLIAGWSAQHHMRAGYFGQSAAVSPGRPYDSMTQWTRAEQRIDARRIALVRFHDPVDPGLLRLIESRTLMALSAARLLLLNRHTSAGIAGSRLNRAQRLAGIAYAQTLTQHLIDHALDGRTNPTPPPAANSREAAIHVVHQANRALDTWEVCERLLANGWVTHGRTPDFTVRRDLRVRERETPGPPRVYTTTHRNRRVYWHPAISKAAALLGYDQAHPVTHTPTQPPSG